MELSVTADMLVQGRHFLPAVDPRTLGHKALAVNLSDLEARFDSGAEVTPESLKEKGLATRRDPVKILGKGDISTKLTVKAHAFSATAKEKIEGAGGTCEVI